MCVCSYTVGQYDCGGGWSIGPLTSFQCMYVLEPYSGNVHVCLDCVVVVRFFLSHQSRVDAFPLPKGMKYEQ